MSSTLQLLTLVFIVAIALSPTASNVNSYGIRLQAALAATIAVIASSSVLSVGSAAR